MCSHVPLHSPYVFMALCLIAQQFCLRRQALLTIITIIFPLRRLTRRSPRGTAKRTLVWTAPTGTWHVVCLESRPPSRAGGCQRQLTDLPSASSTQTDGAHVLPLPNPTFAAHNSVHFFLRKTVGYVCSSEVTICTTCFSDHQRILHSWVSSDPQCAHGLFL